MPQDVAVFLIERYLSHQWNASLLFYKPTLISDFLDNKVPDFVISSIFARASKYGFSLMTSLSTGTKLILAFCSEVQKGLVSRAMLVHVSLSYQLNIPAGMSRNGPPPPVKGSC